MKKSLLWRTASICLLALCLVANALAGVIEVPLGGSVTGFSPLYYRGQTFIALPGVADDLTVYVGESNRIPGPVTYHVLITEIDTASGFHPTNVLYESGPLVTNIGYGRSPPPITVDLGGLYLTAGEKYAWILDAYVEIDANPPLNPGGPYPSASVGTNYYFGDDFPDIEQLSARVWSGTREEHFNSRWYINTRDLAFIMNFSDVIPVPLDIKPRKNPKNVIDLRKDKELKVAIAGSVFDALQVDPSTVKFGLSEASPINFIKVQDYNHDGFSDLILIFNRSETGIVCGVTEATLTGETYAGEVVEGSDTFTVGPCP